MRNLGREALVVQEQKVKLPDVVDEELLETTGEEVAGLLVATVTDLTFARREHSTGCADSMENVPSAWEAGP